MKYSISESNGTKTYMVNDVIYESLNDVPPQFRHLFEDKNSDGTPDGFEMPLDMSSPLAMIKSLFNSGKHDSRDAIGEKPKENKNRNTPNYNRDSEPTLKSTIVKIVLVSLFVLVLYWVYTEYITAAGPN